MRCKFRLYCTALMLGTAMTSMSARPAAAMPPVIGAVAAFAATPIGGFVIQAGLSIAIGQIAQLLFPATDPAPAQRARFGVQLELQAGGDKPLFFPIGRTAVAGQRVYAGSWGEDGGTPNAFLSDMRLLSILPLADNPGIWVGEKLCSIDWEATPAAQGYPITELAKSGKDHGWVRVLDGTQTTADSFMRAKFGSDPDRPFTSDMVYTGCALAIVTFRINKEQFGYSPPDVLFETTGISLYDVAKDTSVGGDGAHRWDDPSTWEPSDSPAVQWYNLRRGIFYAGEWVYGGSNKGALAAHRLPVSNWIAAINECAAPRALPDSGSEPQFRSGGLVYCEVEPGDYLDALQAAAGAQISDDGGIYKMHAGGPGAAVYAFTDADINVSEAQGYEPFPPLERRNNASESVYPEPAERWVTRSAPGRYKSDWEDEDGGRRLVQHASYNLVPYANQVQWLDEIALRNGRRWRTHELTLPPDASLLEGGDVLSWTSAENNYTAKKFVLIDYTGRRALGRRVLVREVDPADYDFDAGAVYAPHAVGVLDRISAPVQATTGVSVEAYTHIDADDAARRPGIKVFYPALLDDVTHILVRVRRQGETLPFFESAPIPYDSESETPSHNLIGDYLLSAQPYEVQVELVPGTERRVTASSWLSVTTPLVPLQTIDFSKDLQNLLSFVTDDIYARMADFEVKLGDLAMVVMDAEILSQERVTGLLVRNRSAAAAVVRVEKVTIENGLVAASLSEQVTSLRDDLSADGRLVIKSTINEETSEATISFAVRANAGDIEGAAVFQLGAFADGLGGTSDSWAGIMADRFYFLSTAGEYVSQPFAIEANFVKVTNLRFENMTSIDGYSIELEGRGGTEEFPEPFIEVRSEEP